MAAFSFAYNPFVVLPVSLKASARDVEDSFQRRLAARPQDEAALTRARRLLLEPDSRLAAEVAWLIDVGPKDAVVLLGAMAGGNQSALLDALANQPPLSKANVAADACARLKSAAFLHPLAAAHRALDPVALAGHINEIHQAIPMAEVGPRQVGAAMQAITMLHAGAALEAISAQVDPAFALAAITQGPDAATGAFLDELTRQYDRRYPPAPPPEVANDQVANDVIAPAEPIAVGEDLRAPSGPAPVAAPIAGAFAEVHTPEHQAGWGEGEDAAAAAASAFMDAQLIFSAHDRFDTYGNARRVRRALYVLGGSLAAVVLLILVFAKGPPDTDAPSKVVKPMAVASAATGGRHHHEKKQCITVSGASYCTN
jgi:hypothetical protein